MNFKIVLPSCGKIRNVPRELNVAEWTMLDIKDMTKASDSAIDDVFNDVLNRGIQREGLAQTFHAGRLSDQDRLHILLTMRGNTVGFDFDFKYFHQEEDPKTMEICGGENTIGLDIRKDINYVDLPKSYKDHIPIELPSSKDLIRIKVPSYDFIKSSKTDYEEHYGKSINDMRDENPDDEDVILFYYALYISGVNNKHFKKIHETLEFMNGANYKDSQALIQTVRFYRNWGPDLVLERVCKKCKRSFQFRFPFIDSFFFEAGKYEFDIEGAIKIEQISEPESNGLRPDDDG